MTTVTEELVKLVIETTAKRVFEGNKEKGFWPEGSRNKLEQHMLIVSEVAEMTEAVRKVEPMASKKIPEFTEEEEELADVLIRVFDYAGGHSLRLGEAVIEKLRYNQSRPFKHGKTC